MTKIAAVLPYIDQAEVSKFMEHYDDELDLYMIDNTGEEGTTNFNVGVAESWNMGIDHMRQVGADWLIILSAAMRFGEDGIEDMLEQIADHPEAGIIHFAEKHVKPQGFDAPPTFDSGVFYWHCAAVHKSVFNKVGYFDPNFYPIYLEDTDFDLRVNKLMGAYKVLRLILPIDAKSAGLSHAVKSGKVVADPDKNIAYFATKWGRHPSAKELGEYDTPFNNPENTLAFFPPAKGRLWNE